MCGTIREAQSVEQAVDYALAYAVYMTTDDGDEPAVYPQDMRRDCAVDFILAYVPAKFRKEARARVASKTDAELVSTLDYELDVVD